MRDMQKVMDLWGAWANSESCDIDYSPIAAGFKGLLPETSKTRIMCSDNDGLIIEGCMARLRKSRPYDYQLLVAYYLFQISKRKMAKSKKKSEKQIRIEMQLAEGFIEGCLSMLEVKLDMDEVVCY
ncbi:TPA: antiterminator Q family protein [Klebsiella quasipneumoniae subsp. quasipneumoniae]|nr:antitermination protein Q [Klebsiella quasipneumoniae subsp. quasipneumoniae]HBU5901268.1 antitermination protein Q [Klebsiella quasipneumoniae subsp. quasipneumoniae]HBZ0086980.1 antitermination protein Q [Klebsiella pneumoniae]HCB0902387.1 antitermination protein Q [Klebsiella pneumoniae]HCB0934407.1 antitermination protein Q [Klebsiella pneumoniae]